MPWGKGSWGWKGWAWVGFRGGVGTGVPAWAKHPFGFCPCVLPWPWGPTQFLGSEPERDPGRAEIASALCTDRPGRNAWCLSGLSDPTCAMGVIILPASCNNGLSRKAGSPCFPLLCCPSGLNSPHTVHNKDRTAEKEGVAGR